MLINKIKGLSYVLIILHMTFSHKELFYFWNNYSSLSLSLSLWDKVFFAHELQTS